MPLIIEVILRSNLDWNARYAGEDNTLRFMVMSRFINIDTLNVMGVDMTDKNAADDIPVVADPVSFVKELVLAQREEQYIFKLRSQDVLHSAYMPHFRAQMNCVPGMVTQIKMTPTVYNSRNAVEYPEVTDRRNLKLHQCLEKITRERRSL